METVGLCEFLHDDYILLLTLSLGAFRVHTTKKFSESWVFNWASKMYFSNNCLPHVAQMWQGAV